MSIRGKPANGLSAQARLEAERLFRATADAAPVMIWTAGDDKLCTFFNKGWLSFTGRRMDEELGDGWASGVHADDLDRCFRTYSEAFDARRDFSMEYRLRRHDGEYRWVVDAGAPRWGAEGEFVGYIGVAYDVTDRVRAAERLRLAVESSPNAMVMMNSAGEIVLFNAQAEKVFGYDREELFGRSIEVLIPERFGASHPGHRDTYFNAPTARAMGAGRDLHGRRKDGSEIPIEVGLGPVTTPEGAAVLASIIDITERRKMEHDTVLQRDQLAHLSRVAMLGELSGSLAHELSQPLTAILTNAEAATRFLAQDPLDKEDFHSLLADIAASGKRAGEVITRLRAMFRNDVVRYVPLDVNEVATDVLKLLHSDLLIRRVTLVTELAAGSLLVAGDRVQLQQVLVNLLMNGCDAMEGMTAERELTLRTAANALGDVEVSVEDRGKGIAAKDLERIFNPFVSTKTDGMGLGLTVCRTIISAHRGRISAANNADRGATLRFVLPATKKSPEEQPSRLRADEA